MGSTRSHPAAAARLCTPFPQRRSQWFLLAAVAARVLKVPVVLAAEMMHRLSPAGLEPTAAGREHQVARAPFRRQQVAAAVLQVPRYLEQVRVVRVETR
jgi:hypothetical protein